MSRVGRFASHQVDAVRRGGPRVLLRQAGKGLGLLTLAPVAALWLVGLRLVSPLRRYRLAPLRSDRIGHFAANTEVWLCERDAGLHGDAREMYFFADRGCANAQLATMWGRTLRMLPCWLHPLARVAFALDRRMSRRGAFRVDRIVSSHGALDTHRLLATTQPHLTFTAEEDARGRAALAELGVPDGADFVCFHARDSAFLATERSGRDFSYHDFRDVDLAAYLPAAAELAGRGYYVIRLGSVVAAPLPAGDARIVDYPNSGLRSDFMDVWLGANCRFFYGSDSGIYAVPAVFRRPIVFADFPGIEGIHAWGSNYIHVPKLLRDSDDGHLLTFRETVSRGVGWPTNAGTLEHAGVEFVGNTADEVRDAVVEMEERLTGTWEPRPDDDDLQARFWECLSGSGVPHHCGPKLTRIGSAFLRAHSDLLE